MPESKKSICFFAKAPNNVLMFRRLYDALKHDPRLNLYLCGEWEGSRKPHSLYQIFNMNSGNLLWLPLVKWRHFDMLISPDVTMAAPKARWRIQIYHGISFKGRPYQQEFINKFNKLFLIGEDMRRRYVKRGVLMPNDSCLENIGMPKTDPLVQTDQFNRLEEMVKLGLDSSKPTILYAPTWRRESSIYTFGRELISYLRQSPYNVLIKLHDWLYDLKRNPINWRAELSLLKRPGLYVVEDYDIIPYLRLTDVLISDASSVANEFLLLDRPIIFLDVPMLFEKYKDTIDLDGWGRKTGVVTGNVRETIKAIEEAISNPTHLSEVRREAAKDFFYNPGTATQSALNKIYNLLELSPPSL